MENEWVKSKNNLQFIYFTTKGYRIIFLLLFLCIMGNSFTTLLFPHFIGKIVDVIFYTQNFPLFFQFLFLYLGIYLLNQLINCGLNYCYAYLKATYLVDIKKKCFAKIQKIQAEFFSSIKTGDIIKRMNGDVDGFLEFIHFSLFYSINDAFHLLFSVFYLFYLSVFLGGICVILVPVLYYMTTYFTKCLAEEKQKLEQDKGILAAWIFELMNGLTEIKLLDADQKMRRDYLKYSQEIVEEEKKVGYKNIRFQRIQVFFLLVGQLLFYMISAYAIKNGGMSVGQFIAACTYFTNCSKYYKNFIERITDIITNKIAIERIKEIFLYEEEKEEDHGIFVNSLTGKICFSNVDFSYGSTKVLDHLDLSISSGEHIVIVGKSGEGKSTIVNLLCGFYEKNSGNIFIDDIEIEKYSLKCLREKLGVVEQQGVIFEHTVRYNLIFSEDISRDEEIWSVLKKVDLFEEVSHMDKKLDTLIGAEGRQLSGGQKQRLVIARMLLKNPDILILDEATSAIDEDCGCKIMDILQKEYQSKTVISISHKFSNILQAERILVLDAGKIVAEGNHKMLYQSCEIYRNLYDSAKSVHEGKIRYHE